MGRVTERVCGTLTRPEEGVRAVTVDSSWTWEVRNEETKASNTSGAGATLSKGRIEMNQAQSRQLSPCKRLRTIEDEGNLSPGRLSSSPPPAPSICWFC